MNYVAQVAATDASVTHKDEKDGRNRVGYGRIRRRPQGVPTRRQHYGEQEAEELAQQEATGVGRGETTAMLNGRTGAGMWGGGLPDSYEIADVTPAPRATSPQLIPVAHTWRGRRECKEYAKNPR